MYISIPSPIASGPKVFAPHKRFSAQTCKNDFVTAFGVINIKINIMTVVLMGSAAIR